MRLQARREGKSFSAFVADAGRKALESRSVEQVKPFRLVTFRGNGAHASLDLDRTSELIAAEDRRQYGEPTQ